MGERGLKCGAYHSAYPGRLQGLPVGPDCGAAFSHILWHVRTGIALVSSLVGRRFYGYGVRELTNKQTNKLGI